MNRSHIVITVKDVFDQNVKILEEFMTNELYIRLPNISNANIRETRNTLSVEDDADLDTLLSNLEPIISNMLLAAAKTIDDDNDEYKVNADMFGWNPKNMTGALINISIEDSYSRDSLINTTIVVDKEAPISSKLRFINNIIANQDYTKEIVDEYNKYFEEFNDSTKKVKNKVDFSSENVIEILKSINRRLEELEEVTQQLKKSIK